jgi:DNA-binding MarR family transcriptional regulator
LQVKRAGEKGERPIDISRKTGYNIADVHTMLGYLFDDGEVEVTRPDGRVVRYVLRETEDERAARLKAEEERKVAIAEIRKGNFKHWRALPRGRIIAVMAVVCWLFLVMGALGVLSQLMR